MGPTYSREREAPVKQAQMKIPAVGPAEQQLNHESEPNRMSVRALAKMQPR